jgi:hypothetical protein
MIESDPTPNFRVAKAICMLQTLFGIIPRIFGKGKNAKVCHLMHTQLRIVGVVHSCISTAMLLMHLFLVCCRSPGEDEEGHV